MKLIDAHVHLSDEEYSKHIGDFVAEAKKSNVVALVANSMNLETSIKSLKLAEEFPEMIYAALGIHPGNVNALAEDELQQTLQLISEQSKNRAVVAIGEIGLDYKYAKTQDKQLMVFNELLNLAEEMDLPIIVHSRGITEQILEMLPSFNIRKVLFHWFSNPISVLPEVVQKGYYITEGPPAAYSNSIREVVRRIPLSNLLTETDGPVRYWKEPFSGKRTTPAFIPIVVKAIAEIKNESEIDVSDQIMQNFEEFFGIELDQSS